MLTMYYIRAFANIFRSTKAHRNELENYNHSFILDSLIIHFLKVLNVQTVQLNTKRKYCKLLPLRSLQLGH